LILRGLATMARSFAFLRLLPDAASRFRFWFFFRYPNKFLERKIAHLQSELLRQSDLQPRPEPDQPVP
jgi:hypothetical protein